MKKALPGYEGLYQMDWSGRVFNSKGLELKQQKINSGYLIVHLYKGGIRKAMTIHRIVAELFCENPNGHPCVLHIDDNKTNNYFKNLKWGTLKENSQAAFANGLMENCKAKAAIRMREIGLKYAKINGQRLSKSSRDKFGRIIKTKI